jgi:hypothetical protein
MKQLKRHQVHMLPTEENSQIVLYAHKTSPFLVYHYTRINSPLSDVSQHLYFTNDEEIKEGDWVLWFWDGDQIGVTEPQQYLGGEQVLNNGHRKITASTDPKLNISRVVEKDKHTYLYKQYIAKINQDFIKAYCEQGGIDEVDVEYEEIITCKLCNKSEEECSDNFTCEGNMIGEDILKLNPENTVITHLIEEKMYSKQDLIELSMGSSTIIDWIKENL